MKTAIFCTCGSNNWETVENRWVHAARDLASTAMDCLFIHATFCVIATGGLQGKQKIKAGVGKMAILPRDAMHPVYAVMGCPSV